MTDKEQALIYAARLRQVSKEEGDLLQKLDELGYSGRELQDLMLEVVNGERNQNCTPPI